MTPDIEERITEKRKPSHEIHPIFTERWSPRALERDMTEEDLMALFEAARWAPSSYNNQSWRFLYSTYQDDEWKVFKDLMNDFNTKWAEKGFALVLIASKTTFDHNGEESITNSFDTGAAWENLALEAARRDLVAHGMQGFDYKKARELLEIPEEFKVEAMIAIGSKGDESSLLEDMQVKPNGRKELEEIVTKGKFSF